MIAIISYLNRNNRHAYNRSLFIFSIRSCNSSRFIAEVNNMPINIIGQEIFNHSNTRFKFNLLRGFGYSSITLTNNSWSFSMILYSNRERWFLNISSRNNRIIISDSLFFNFNRCKYFYFNGGLYLNHFSLGRSTWVAKDSQKEATISESSPYLVLNSRKASVSIKDLTQSNFGVIPHSLPSSRSQSLELHLIL